MHLRHQPPGPRRKQTQMSVPSVDCRRRLAGLFGAADGLPGTSRASRILVALGCRIQLFLLELEHNKCKPCQKVQV